MIRLLAVVLTLAAVPALAGELPADIWDGHYGGTPAISASRDGGVSVVLPGGLLVDGSIVETITAFLNRWAPGMCSDVFDFQSPHPGLRVMLYVQETEWTTPTASFYVVSPRGGSVTIDYAPARQVRCVEPLPPTS